MEREQAAHRLGRRRLAQTQRHHEADGLRLASERLSQRDTGLKKCEVEGCALEGPAAVEPPLGHGGRVCGEEIELSELL